MIVYIFLNLNVSYMLPVYTNMCFTFGYTKDTPEIELHITR